LWLRELPFWIPKTSLRHRQRPCPGAIFDVASAIGKAGGLGFQAAQSGLKCAVGIGIGVGIAFAIAKDSRLPISIAIPIPTPIDSQVKCAASFGLTDKHSCDLSDFNYLVCQTFTAFQADPEDLPTN
jgi:hypothetical protein